MRILHTEASTGFGGQEIRILEESMAFIARGDDVRIMASAQARIIDAAAKRGIPTFTGPIDHRSLAAVRALRTVVDDFRPDVVITHSSTDSWLSALGLRFKAGRPLIVRTRHVSVPVAQGIQNRFLYGRVPDHVVTTGEAVRTHLIKRLGLDPAIITSVPTGIDVGRFRPGDRDAARRDLGLPTDRPIIGIVAVMRPWKGHRYLIAALEDPALAGAHLAIVGDGEDEAVLRALVRERGLEPRVTFAGRREDVERWLPAFDVFVLPSTANEGVPQSLMQAMAAGLPVVSTTTGAIGDLVEDGNTGLLVPPEDPGALAAAIASLIASPALAGCLADAGRRHVHAHYTTAAMADGMMAAIERAKARRQGL